jgi:hypothetical protein
MGYWDVHPAAGDQPLDEFHHVVGNAVMKALDAYARKTLRDPYAEWTRVGVIVKALEDELPVSKDTLLRAITDVDNLALSKQWIDAWRDPGQMAENLQVLREALIALLEKRTRSPYVMLIGEKLYEVPRERHSRW